MLFSSVKIALKRTYQASIGDVCSRTLTRSTDTRGFIVPPLYEIRDLITFLKTLTENS